MKRPTVDLPIHYKIGVIMSATLARPDTLINIKGQDSTEMELDLRTIMSIAYFKGNIVVRFKGNAHQTLPVSKKNYTECRNAWRTLVLNNDSMSESKPKNKLKGRFQ